MTINDIVMTGNLVYDPRFSGGNGKKSRTSFRIANTQRYRQADGTWVDGDTTFMDVVCWGFMAENVVESLGKGNPVIVVGHLRTREVDAPESAGTEESRDSQSTPRKTTYTEIVATAVGPNLARVATRMHLVKGPGATRQEEAALAEVSQVMQAGPLVA